METREIYLIIEQEGTSSLFCIAPDSLDKLFLYLKSQPNLDGPLELHYNRKDTWVKVADDATYRYILRRALERDLEELVMKVVSLANSSSVDSWEVMSNSQQSTRSRQANDDNSVFYRILDLIPTEFKKIQLPMRDASLSDLSSLIIRNEGLSPTLTAAMYTEDGYPLTGTLSQRQYTMCHDVIAQNSKICVFIVPNFDQISSERLNPNQGSDTVLLVHKAMKNWHIISKLT